MALEYSLNYSVMYNVRAQRVNFTKNLILDIAFHKYLAIFWGRTITNKVIRNSIFKCATKTTKLFKNLQSLSSMILSIWLIK